MIENLRQSELSTLESMAKNIDVIVKIEQIKNGVIVYFSDTFTKDQFLSLKTILFSGANYFDQKQLPARYCEFRDTFTGETSFFSISDEIYLQNVLKIITTFIPKDIADDLMTQISRRVFFLNPIKKVSYKKSKGPSTSI